MTKVYTVLTAQRFETPEKWERKRTSVEQPRFPALTFLEEIKENCEGTEKMGDMELGLCLSVCMPGNLVVAVTVIFCLIRRRDNTCSLSPENEAFRAHASASSLLQH